jgi:hypothetical protein
MAGTGKLAHAASLAVVFDPDSIRGSLPQRLGRSLALPDPQANAQGAGRGDTAAGQGHGGQLVGGRADRQTPYGLHCSGP